MAEQVHIRVNGQAVNVPAGTVLATALAQTGIAHLHRSPHGHPRAALCGMGVCMECRVMVNGRKYTRSCLVLCGEGMEVQTDE